MSPSHAGRFAGRVLKFPDIEADESWDQRDATTYNLTWLVGNQRDAAWDSYGYSGTAA